MVSHGAVASHFLGETLVGEVLEDGQFSGLTPQAQAMLVYLEKLTLAPTTVGHADITALRASGLSDEAIAEAAAVCLVFSVINRLADAFGFDLPSEFMQKNGARLVGRMGYRPATETQYATPAGRIGRKTS